MASADSPKVTCPGCQQKYVWLEKFANKKVLCKCGMKIRMPATPDGDVIVVSAPPPSDDVPTMFDKPVTSSLPPRVRHPSPPTEETGEIELNLDNVPRKISKPDPVSALEEAAGAMSDDVVDANVLAESAPVPGEGIKCPSCGREYHRIAKICVPCGISIETGRSIITSDPGDLERSYAAADRAFWWVSWPISMGVYPFMTEAVGGRPRYAVWTITAITVLVSIWFWCLMVTDSPSMRSYKQLMLWSGSQPTEPLQIARAYSPYGGMSAMGDAEAFHAKLDQIHESHKGGARKASGAPVDVKPHAVALNKPPPKDDSEDEEEDELAPAAIDPSLANDPAVVEAYNELTPEEKVFGEFSVPQLLTHALLHADFWHIAGNLLFFLVFGLAVNGLIGNVGTAVIYPLLAIFAGIAHHIDFSSEVASPMLGASGAIMGIAGMYLVFFTVHHVHVAAYIRPWQLPLLLLGGCLIATAKVPLVGVLVGCMSLPLFIGLMIVWRRPLFRLYIKKFACRGVWVLLFFIAWDVFYTVTGTKDGVAHWAHLGGFLAGMAIAIILVVSRGVNCRGGDLISVMFGKHAWGLVGKPSQWRDWEDEEGWLQRIKLSFGKA